MSASKGRSRNSPTGCEGSGRYRSIATASACARLTPRFNEMTGRMRDKRLALAHLAIQGQQFSAVRIHREVRHPPYAFAKNPHDCADVMEQHAAMGCAQVGHRQPGRLCCCHFVLRIAHLPLTRQWPQEMLDQLEGRGWPYVLGEVVSTRSEDAMNLGPVRLHRVA